MSKGLKIILGLAAITTGLIIALVVALPFIIDPNDYKDEIAGVVKEHTGRVLTIEGDLGLSVFPWLGLEIGPTQFSNAEGFGEQPMASMEKVQVRVKLLPLLRRQLEVDSVRLAGLKLHLAKDVRGRSNWEDLQGEPAVAKADADKKQGGMLAGLAIGGVDVSDARIIWEDRASKAHYVVDKLSFKTGAIVPGKSFDLDLQFQVNVAEPAVTGKFALSGGVSIAPTLQAVQVDKAMLDVDLQGETLPGGQLTVSLTTDIALDLEQQTLELPELVLEVLGLELKGSASGTSIGAGNPRFNGSVLVSEFVPRELIKTLGQEAPATADSTVLGKAGAKLQWEASSTHAAVTDLQLHMDDTHLNGQMRIDQFNAPAITFALRADDIDLDRYLPTPAKGNSTPPPAAKTPATPAAPVAAAGKGAAAGALPLDALHGLNLDGTLRLDRLKAYQLRSTDIELKIRAKDGLLRVHPATASLYEGQYQGDVSLDVRRDTPRISLDEHVTGVQSGPLLKDLTGDDKLLGQADVTAKLSGAGATPEQIRGSLNGNASFAFTNGAVKGVNIASVIRSAQAKLKGQPAPADDQPNQTDFAELKGTAEVTNGLVSNHDLSLKSPLLRITGKGEISLPKETIDYLLTTKIVGSLEGQGGGALNDLKGIAIPVRIGGTFSKPTYMPDLSAALGEAAKAKVQEKVEEKKRKLQEKVQEKVQEKLLKGLFR